MTLNDETAARIAREVIGGGKAARVYPHSTDVALVRAGYAARDAEVEELRAERDKAREEVGYEKRMRASISEELDHFIDLKRKVEAERDKARADVEELRAELDILRATEDGNLSAMRERAEKAEATLAKVREYAEALALQPDPPADDEMAGQINAAGDVISILDESPTERETPADEWVYSVGGRNSDGSVWCDEDEVTPDIDEAREWVEEALESGTFANACLVRRRKQQVWEVCDDRA